VQAVVRSAEEVPVCAVVAGKPYLTAERRKLVLLDPSAMLGRQHPSLDRHALIERQRSLSDPGAHKHLVLDAEAWGLPSIIGVRIGAACDSRSLIQPWLQVAQIVSAVRSKVLERNSG